MPKTTSINSLNINTMPKKVFDYYNLNNMINSNELYLVEADDDVTSFNGAVTSNNADYAICLEWDDGNPNIENRSCRFVQLANGTNKITFATSTSNVYGVTTTCAAFIENFGVHNEHTSAVGILGIVSVIDNGSCTVGKTCMPDDSGYATPSSNDLGFRVIKRISSDKIQVAIKPNDDTIQRLRNDIDSVLGDFKWVSNEIGRAHV